jgi:muramoyltetrapeptide carboxypeptidase
VNGSLRRPHALRRGDRVAVLSVSSPAELRGSLDAGVEALRLAGLEPAVYPTARDRGSVRPFLAGDDTMRIGDLRAALLDDSIAGVLFACGGSGAQRTLEALDWTGLDALEPKLLAGYSDVTAVLEAFAVRLGWASVHSTMVVGGSPFSFMSMLAMITDPGAAMTLDFPDATTAVSGMASGRTMGGNLTLLASSVGTVTSWPAAGGLLMLEDEGEDAYRVDRMLTQLRRSGYLDGVAGIVCGHWYRCGDATVIEAVLRDRLGSLGVPMITGANIGYGGPNGAWPIGIQATLDADKCRVELADPPLLLAR